MSQQIELAQPGDKVRSFDFPTCRDLEGERACFVTGIVRKVHKAGTRYNSQCQPFMCDTLEIDVSARVWGGELQGLERDGNEKVFPPQNGIVSTLGGKTAGVEILKRA